MITIGSLAKKYGQLPSQVAAAGTTYDLMIDDIMTTWENYQNNPSAPSNFNDDDLQEFVKEI